MGRKRTFDSASCSRDVDEELSQPSVKMPRPLRRSQSLRARGAGVVELAYQLAELNAEQAPDQDTEVGEDPMVVELERPGAEHPEEVEEAADEVQEEISFQQQVIYGAAFKVAFRGKRKNGKFFGRLFGFAWCTSS
ncbi:hypothetical protein OSTOST_15455 [Ostertagia ostertagi]